VPQIAGVLRRVAAAEEIEIGDEAVAVIARSATGSFRDALGTLEQLLAYSGPSIALDDVLAVLGAADAELVFGAVDAVAAGDVRAALLAAARLADSGRDLGRFFGDLETHARGLMVVQALGELPAELRVTAEQDERLAAQAQTVAPADVVRLLELIAAALRALKDGADARTQLELVLVKAAEPAHDPSAKALLARIERLESRMSGAPAAPLSHDPGQAATAAGRTRAALRAPAAVAVVEADEPRTEPAAHHPGAPAPVPDEPDLAAPARAPADPDLAAPADPDLAAPADHDPELSLEAFEELWPAVLQTLEGESPRVAGLLRQATPAALDARELTLAWPESAAFSKRQAEEPAKRALIAESIRAVTGASLRLAHELRSDHELAAAATLTDDELVARFKAEFDAEELPPPDEES
jgi:DNA polymerase-3 subunit gamma/tau